ncbi:Uncharacterised protein [Candidatus Burarchaeum australiense]|nr:Uncharacterised protein [Candidatus Burarchaeum australiense]
MKTTAKNSAPGVQANCTLARIRELVRTNPDVARAVEILKREGVDVKALAERNESGAFGRPSIEDIFGGKGFI